MSEKLSLERSDPADEEQLALEVGGKLRKKKREASQAAKKDISKGAPQLKASPAPSASASRQGKAFRQAWRKTAGDLSEGEQRTAVLQALEVFRQLPPASSYAQHRIRVLEKALALLDKANSELSSEEQDELQQLLSQLKI